MNPGHPVIPGRLAWRQSLVLLLTLFTLPCFPFSGIIHIPKDYSFIQEAIDASIHGDTLLIHEGHYYENIDFRGKAITLASLFLMDGDSTHIPKTIIDGSRATDSTLASVIRLASGEDTSSVIKGLTITGGRGSLVNIGGMDHMGGGGIFIGGCGGKVEDNIIEYNHLSYQLKVNTGAGIMAGVGDGKSLVIRNNLIRYNTAISVLETDGGGMTIAGSGSFILIENNQVHNNSVITSGPAQSHGGGMTLFAIIPCEGRYIVRNNTFSYNEAKAIPGTNYVKCWGGGISVLIYENKVKKICHKPYIFISGNHIHHNQSSERGGGIGIHRHSRNHFSDPVCPQTVISNNRITDNRALDGSGLSNLNALIIMSENFLSNDLSVEGCREICNSDISYAYLNHGIINAHQNEVRGGWPGEKGVVFNSYPQVYSFAHSWRIKKPETGLFIMAMLSPSWRSWWAVSLYALVLVSLLYLYRRYLFYRFNLKAALKIERLENERIRDLDQVRSRFFANISHEFRTPLTLISVPVQDMLNEQGISDSRKTALEMIYRNVERLKNLIRQLMELASLEAGATRLRVAPGNLSEFANSIILSYLSLAEREKIRYNYLIAEKAWETWFDADKVDKILNNLLSNAFKYTPGGGEIEVLLNYSSSIENGGPGNLHLSVRNSGPGLEPGQLDHVFDRFFRAESTHKNDKEGSGIGLSLVRELVELYRGSIKAESGPEKGTIFTLSLPADRKQFEEEEIVHHSENQRVGSDSSPEHLVATPHWSGSPAKKGKFIVDAPVVILAEDNDELRNYIIGQLDSDFTMLEAANGLIAFDKARKHLPQLIISDLMMPEMDGAELVEALRNDERTCHIPLIMLTARADLESKMDCFEKGSDEFMEKPFRVDELKARATHLIEQRRKLKESYRRRFLLEPAEFQPSIKKEAFLGLTVACIGKNLSDPEFNVEQLSRFMNLSRVQLYRKFNRLTGYSPVEFIRNTRLERAARLFKEGYGNVSQVMLEVGFSTPSYFTESFRELFGCNPSEYLKNSDKG